MTPAPIAPACPFCETLAGTDADAVVVADAGDAVAVLDRCPVAPGHVLVIPRRHAASLEELTDVECGAVMSLARDVAGAVRAGLAPAVNLHLHLHLQRTTSSADCDAVGATVRRGCLLLLRTQG